MNTGEVHFLPLSGQPLEFKQNGQRSTLCAETSHGFFIGRENAMLEPLIQSIINSGLLPEQLPVLLYGESGTGKTHLLRGLLAAQRKNRTDKGKRSYYLSADDFSRQYADAVANRTTGDFRQRYGNAHLLLLDDIEFLDSKPAVLQELRHFIDTAAESRMIVMTAKTLPAGTDDWTARLIGGTVVPIFPPETAVRQQFLRGLANSLRIPAAETLLNEAAKQMTGTIPQIYAAFVQKYAEYTAKNGNIASKKNADFWSFAVQKRFRQTGSPAETIDRTAKYFALKGSDLKGKSRSKTVALARSIAVYLIKTQNSGCTFRKIGSMFGSRDPSTIRHMYEKIAGAMVSDTVLRDHIFRLSGK
ncbi:MAG: ATP-binding protein [Planctomycetaceae bacterium]|jgi:chromosomal replication initiator protein|nr:ATP-binding protein [Planctomycetaceae bacterium]